MPSSDDRASIAFDLHLGNTCGEKGIFLDL
jgi:hypothetical protein